MVGTDIGTVYRGQQGTGYATVLDTSILERAYQLDAAGRASKAKERADVQKSMEDAAPKEVWHYYSAEVQRKYKEWLEEGAGLMTRKNINNPWASDDTDAVKWQIKGAELRRTVDNINQAKGLYDKAMSDIGTRGDSYDDDYKKSVENFAKDNPFDKIASGQYDFPQAKFKDASKLYDRFFVADAQDLKNNLGEGQLPSQGVVMERVNTFFSVPENEPEKQAAQEMFASLTPDQKDKYTAKAELLGVDDEPWKALAYENYKARFVPQPRNLANDALEYAKSAPKNIASWSKEDASGMTVGGAAEKLSNVNYPKLAAKSHFTEYSYLLDDEAYMNQLGVPMDVPRAKRREQAEKALAQVIKQNITQETSSTVSRQGQGLGDEEIKSNFDQWRKDIGSYDPTVATQAAKWLYANKSTFGEVTEAGVKIEPNVRPPFKTNRWLVLRYENEKEANNFKSKFYSEAIQGTSGLDPSQTSALKEAMDFYQEKSGPNVIAIPVQPEYEQVLKRIHDQTARANKTLYEFVGERKAELDAVGGGSGTPKKKGVLDDL